MIDSRLIAQAAENLWSAQHQRQACAPVRELFDGKLDADTAYRIQQMNVERAVREQGRRIVGKKIGLTSKAVQKQLGVDQPDYGSLFADMIVAEGETVSLSGLLQAKVEAEAALVLKKDLSRTDNSLLDLIQAVDYVLPAIEIVDSRVEDWNIRIGDTIADNASSALVALGQIPVSLAQVNLIDMAMEMVSGSRVVSSGHGTACLGNPLVAALWLANTMARCGTPLQAGDLILTGALGPMVAVTEAATFTANMSGLGSVRVTFGE